MNNRDYHLEKARRTKAEVDWSTYKRLRNRVNVLIDKAYKLVVDNTLTIEIYSQAFLESN